MNITTVIHDDKLHRVRISLYPNYLKLHIAGNYLARTIHEGTLNIEEVCDQMILRGGYTGDYQTLVANVKAYLRECCYQIADGWAVSTGYYTLYPNISGTFMSGKEPFNPQKHRIGIRLRANADLRKLIGEIDVVVEGVSDAKAFIYEFIDTEEDSVNGLFLPGNLFTLAGSKIKVEGDDTDCGVFFVPVDDPSEAVKVTRIAQNKPSKIIGIAPDTKHQFNRIEVRTRHSGSKKVLLKEPRIIASDFVIEAL